MTEGERKKWEYDCKTFQAAIARLPRGHAMEALFAAISMTLGAVLGDEQLRRNYETILSEVKSFGVEPVSVELTSWLKPGEN
jgi:hypothetical protein